MTNSTGWAAYRRLRAAGIPEATSRVDSREQRSAGAAAGDVKLAAGHERHHLRAGLQPGDVVLVKASNAARLGALADSLAADGQGDTR